MNNSAAACILAAAMLLLPAAAGAGVFDQPAQPSSARQDSSIHPNGGAPEPSARKSGSVFDQAPAGTNRASAAQSAAARDERSGLKSGTDRKAAQDLRPRSQGSMFDEGRTPARDAAGRDGTPSAARAQDAAHRTPEAGTSRRDAGKSAPALNPKKEGSVFDRNADDHASARPAGGAEKSGTAHKESARHGTGQLKGNRESKVYHNDGCPYYKNAGVPLKSAAEAQAQGFRACKRCGG